MVVPRRERIATLVGCLFVTLVVTISDAFVAAEW
jgi:hypothetical protein